MVYSTTCVHFNNIKEFTMKKIMIAISFVVVVASPFNAFAEQPDAFDGVPVKEVSRAKLDKATGGNWWGDFTNWYNNSFGARSFTGVSSNRVNSDMSTGNYGTNMQQDGCNVGGFGTGERAGRC
jgi:hypothetical protein